jgi:hypothetical protein
MKNKGISEKRLKEIWDDLVKRHDGITKKRDISETYVQKLSDISYEAQKYIQEFLAAKYDANQLIDMLNSDEVILKWFDEFKKIGADIEINDFMKRCTSKFIEEHWRWFCRHAANVDYMAWKCFGDDEHIYCAADLEKVLKKAPEIKPRTAYNLTKKLILTPYRDISADEVEVVFSILIQHGLDPSVFGNWLKLHENNCLLYETIIDDIIRGKCKDIVPDHKKYIDEWCQIYAKVYIGSLEAIPRLIPIDRYLNYVTVDQILNRYRNNVELVLDFPGPNKLLAEKALKEFGGYPKGVRQAELLIALLDNSEKNSLSIDANELASTVDTRNMVDAQKRYFHEVLENRNIKPELLKKFEVTKK